MIDELISALLQILAFTLVPFVAYLVSRQKMSGFLDYLGLHRTTSKALLLAGLTSLVFITGGVLLAFLNDAIREILINPPSVTGKIRSMGISPVSFVILLIIALLKTSLSEEILFRGFIGKRLVKRLGLRTGNIIQASIFAAVHVLVFKVGTNAGPAFLIFIFMFSGSAGYLIEVINEKYGKGSILPGWLAHGLGNAISYTLLAFVL